MNQEITSPLTVGQMIDSQILRIPIVPNVQKLRMYEIVLDSELECLVLDIGRTQETYALGTEQQMIGQYLDKKNLAMARIYPDRFGLLGYPFLPHIDLGVPTSILNDGCLMFDQNLGILRIGFKGQNRLVRVV